MIIAMGQNEVPATGAVQKSERKTVSHGQKNGRKARHRRTRSQSSTASARSFNWPCKGPRQVPFPFRGPNHYPAAPNAPRHPPKHRRSASHNPKKQSRVKKSAVKAKKPVVVAKVKVPPTQQVQDKPKAPTPRVLPTGCFCFRVNGKEAFFYPKRFSGEKIVGTLYSRMTPKEQGGVANGTRTVDMRTRRVKNGQYYLQYTNYATKLATPKNSCSKPKWDKELRRLMDRLIRETIRAEE